VEVSGFWVSFFVGWIIRSVVVDDLEEVRKSENDNKEHA